MHSQYVELSSDSQSSEELQPESDEENKPPLVPRKLFKFDLDGSILLSAPFKKSLIKIIHVGVHYFPISACHKAMLNRICHRSNM